MTAFQSYCCEYEYEGGRWAFEIPATSQSDAAKRLIAIARTGTVEGVKVAEIECSEDDLRLP